MNIRCFVLVFLVSLQSHALIYGIDDRKEALNSWAKDLAPSVLLMAPRNFMIDNGHPDHVQLDFQKISGDDSMVGICANEKFSSQYTAGINCSGFLIAPDLVITAGHCISPYGGVKRENTPACSDFIWIADFAVSANNQPMNLKEWPRSKIFDCAEVIEASHPDFSSAELAPPYFGNDFALVRLKKPITDRKPLKLSEKLVPASQLYVMGYPLGLPLKLAGPARIIDNSFERFYSTNLDAFMGNSGSPIIDGQGVVQGILVRGYPDDFLTNSPKECHAMNSCNESGTRCQETSDFFPTGEHVQRLDVVHAAIRSYQGLDAPMVAARPFFKPPMRADALFTPHQGKERSARAARPRTFIDANLARPGEVAPKRSSLKPSWEKPR